MATVNTTRVGNEKTSEVARLRTVIARAFFLPLAVALLLLLVSIAYGLYPKPFIADRVNIYLTRACFAGFLIMIDKPFRIGDEIKLPTGERVRTLDGAVGACVHPEMFGSWLSGGLDSSAMVALAGPKTRKLHTFAAGLRGAEDLDYARAVAGFVVASR